MPSLYVVATPIGNLEDITLRALRVLREVTLIAAEDTRKTSRLLARYEIKTPMTSYYEHNKLAKLDYIISCLDKVDVALVSEAGTPGINDPGYELIGAAIARKIPVITIPGPSTVTASLPVSGLPTDRFLYLGFLPNRSGARINFLKTLTDEKSTMIILEAPHRIPASLKDILSVLGDRHIAVCREITKLHEEIFRGTVSEAISHFQSPRGEFTLVIEGSNENQKPEMTEDIGQRLKKLREAGVPAKEAIAGLVKETGLSRKELYRKWLDSKNSENGIKNEELRIAAIKD